MNPPECDRESGFTLVEALVASAVMLIILTIVTTSIVTATRTSQNASNEGLALGPALLAEQEAQQILESAWAPPSANGITSDCTGNTSGGAFPSSQGSFVEASTTGIEFCGILGSTLTAYTYNMFVSSTTKSLEVDRWLPAGGTPVVVFKMSGLSGTGSPFTFYKASSGSWLSVPTVAGAVATANLSTIGAVQIALTATASGSNSGSLPGATLPRIVVLSNAGPGET